MIRRRYENHLEPLIFKMQHADIFLKHNKNSQKFALISKILRDHEHLLEWRPEEMILDVGCGPGDLTANVLLPWLPPDFKTLLGVDISPAMVAHAMAHNASDKVNFSTVDIAGDVSHILRDTTGFDKIFSFFVMHWVEDLGKGVTNLYYLLNPGGQALMYFTVERSLETTFSRVAAMEKWKGYFKNVSKRTYSFPTGGDPNSEFKEMLSNAGFEILKCDMYKTHYEFPSVEAIKDLFESVNPDIDCVPFDLKPPYLDDCLKVMMEMNAATVKENKATHNMTVILCLIRKPKL